MLPLLNDKSDDDLAALIANDIASNMGKGWDLHDIIKGMIVGTSDRLGLPPDLLVTDTVGHSPKTRLVVMRIEV